MEHGAGGGRGDLIFGAGILSAGQRPVRLTEMTEAIPMPDYRQALIDAAYPYWEAEAEIARRFFGRGDIVRRPEAG